MLIGQEQRERLQISRPCHYISKLRQMEVKGVSKNSNRSTIRAECIQPDPRKTQPLKLPQIISKNQNVGLLKEAQIKRQKQKKPIEKSKIMELIQREMFIEKKNYFETISSERALIIKDTGRNHQNPVTETSQQQNGQKVRIIFIGRQEVMTPPLKAYRLAKTEANGSLPKTKKKTINYLERQESCSPWNYQESEDHTLQADCIQVESRKTSTPFQLY